MFFLSRSDGIPVTGESTLRRLMPYILPRRSDAVVFFEQKIDVTNLLQYLKKRKEEGLPEITLFQALLTSMLRANYHWPKMNRFIAGKRIYQRKTIGLSFAVKKKMHEDAGMTVVKKEFEGHETVFDVAKQMNESIKVGRGDKLTKSEKEMKLIHFVPGFVVSFFIWAQRKLDGLNLLPSALTRDDPLYTSMFVANLGSFGLDSPFHHMFEHGTAPIFAAIGNVHRAPAVDKNDNIVARDFISVRYSFDERIIDGFYCARAMQEFADALQTPEILEQPSAKRAAQEAKARAQPVVA